MKHRLISILAAVLILTASSVWAHEFIVKPNQLTVQPGQTLPVNVVSAHVFMVSEEMEPLKQVDLSLINGKSIKPLTLKENNAALTLEGAVAADKPGTAILAGHRKGMIWTQTTTGWQQAAKSQCKGVIQSGNYEKFCKTLISVGKEDQGYDKQVGHALEIVPLSNPAKASLGQDLEFKILFNGQPLSTEVWATYDGFSQVPNTYAYYTECDENGIARVKITQPGVWMVRTQHKIDKPGKDYDSQVIRSVLVFGVQ